MPDGHTHMRATLISTAVISSTLLIPSIHQKDLVISAAFGCLTGILISPDLDLADKGNLSHFFVLNYMGRFPYLLWWSFWWPYGKAISHRSRVSHQPILGTLGRIAYFMIPFSIIAFLLIGSQELYNLLVTAMQAGVWKYILAWTIGLMTADFVHYKMDNVHWEKPDAKKDSRD